MAPVRPLNKDELNKDTLQHKADKSEVTESFCGCEPEPPTQTHSLQTGQTGSGKCTRSDQRKEYRARYMASEKGKAKLASYLASERGKASRARAQAKYFASDKGKKARAKYNASRKSKNTRAMYLTSDKGKVNRRIAQAKYCKSVKFRDARIKYSLSVKGREVRAKYAASDKGKVRQSIRSTRSNAYKAALKQGYSEELAREIGEFAVTEKIASFYQCPPYGLSVAKLKECLQSLPIPTHPE